MLWLQVEIILVLVLHWQLPFVKPDIKQLFSYIWCSFAQAKVGGGKVHLADYFDLFSGTSTGAVLATMLVTPNEKGEPLFTADGCCQFYQEQGKYIFKPRWYDPFNGSLRQLYRPKYSARRFENLLKLYTVRKGQALTLLDTLKPIVVTSFDISKATPFFFMRHAATKDPSHNFSSILGRSMILNFFLLMLIAIIWRLWEVCRATAAAPTYFPPAYVTSVDGTINGTLIDGGAIQNNPALVATTHALSNNEEFPEATSLQDILILSLGAGQMDKTHELSRAKKWGMTGWVRPIMDIMMDGTAGTRSCLQIYQANSLLSLTAHWTSLNLGPWLDFIIDEQGINHLPVASHRWGFYNTKSLKTWPTHQL
jgi:hypothetical protein